jgi:hypothetical protein
MYVQIAQIHIELIMDCANSYVYQICVFNVLILAYALNVSQVMLHNKATVFVALVHHHALLAVKPILANA